MKQKWFICLALVVTLMAACGGTETPTGGGDEVASSTEVELKEYTVVANPNTVAAGSVEFTAKNSGTIPHELVVIRTDLAADQLPTSEGAVSEEDPAIDLLGEIEEFDAGGTQSASFDLTAGKYVIICNVPGHYQLGMRTSFTVSG